MVLQELVVEAEAKALLEMPRKETPAATSWFTGAAGCCFCCGTAWGGATFRPFLFGGSA